MRIYKYSMRFRVPALDQSDCSICYNYDLIIALPQVILVSASWEKGEEIVPGAKQAIEEAKMTFFQRNTD